MATQYNMRQHTEAKNGKPPVVGVALHRDGLAVRTWIFSQIPVGHISTFEFGGYAFALRMTKKRYVNRRHKSGFSVVKMVAITATKNGKAVDVPRWFQYVHNED